MLSLGVCRAGAVQGFFDASPSAFFRVVSFLSFSNYPPVKVSDSVLQENLQLDKSHISGPAWYVSYCVIGKELNYLLHEFRNMAAVQTPIYYLSNAIWAL